MPGIDYQRAIKAGECAARQIWIEHDPLHRQPWVVYENQNYQSKKGLRNFDTQSEANASLVAEQVQRAIDAYEAELKRQRTAWAKLAEKQS